MTASARTDSLRAGHALAGAALLGAVLVFAPLIKGGNRPLPLLILELAALGLLAQALLRPTLPAHVSRPMLAALAALLLLPLVQMVPLPEAIWSRLPGREAYAAALAALGGEPHAGALSIVPRATEAAWLALLPPVAVFLATATLPDDRLKMLVQVFIGMAVFQAVLCMAQYGTGSESVLWQGQRINSGIGTYANQDHLAGMLEMALPLALALLAASIHPGAPRRTGPHRRPTLRKRLAALFASGFRLNRVALLAAASIAILLGMVATRSRAGVALGMLAILLCGLAFARRLGGGRTARVIVVFSVIGLVLAVEIGLVPVLMRYTVDHVAADARWSIFAGTLAGIAEFFPLGSGIGTFPHAYRRFQTEDVALFVNHAHNDYLEWLFEGGAVAGALVLAFLVLYLLRWPKLWVRESWSQLRFAQIAAGIGLLLIGLHGLVDFNLHIPANAIYFAFLAGLFFHRETIHAHAPARPARRAGPSPEPAPPPAPAAPPKAPVPNPFAE